MASLDISLQLHPLSLQRDAGYLLLLLVGQLEEGLGGAENGVDELIVDAMVDHVGEADAGEGLVELIANGCISFNVDN